MFFSVDNLKKGGIIAGVSAAGVFILFLIYRGRKSLLVYIEKRRKKKIEVDMMVVTIQEEGPIYQKKEGATGVEKLDHSGPIKVVTTQKEILIYQR